jgi:hypothetical protein
MTLRETVAAGSHLTPSRREPGGGPHGGGGRHAFDDISSGLRPSAAHFVIAPLVIFLNFSLPSPLHVSLTLWRRIECLLPRPKYLAMRGRSRPCRLGSSGPRHLREVCVCVCVRVCVCVYVCVCVRVSVSVSVSVSMICSGPERPQCSTASLFCRHHLSTYNDHARGLHTLPALYTAVIITTVVAMQMHLLFIFNRRCFRVCLKETGRSNTDKGSGWREGMHRPAIAQLRA